MSRRYVVIGAGAVGGVLAAQLHTAGRDVVLVARGAHLEAIRRDGLRVRRPAGDDVVRLSAVAGPEELQLRHDDVLALTVKAQDAEDVLRAWAYRPVLDAEGRPTLLGADLPVLTFQNGLATEDVALRRFRQVYGVSIGIAASHLTPGEVVSPSWPTVGVVWIGSHPDAPAAGDPLLAELVADLVAAGYLTQAVDDISAWKARKLLANLRNGLDLLAGPDDLRARLLSALEAEARAAFAAAGIDIASAPAGFPLTVEAVPGHEPGRLSTWQSFARGAGSEVDHLTGEVVLLGRRTGVATPVNERLQRVLGAQAAASEPPGSHRLDELGPPPAPALDRLVARLSEAGVAVTLDGEALAAAGSDRSGTPSGHVLAVVQATSVDDVRVAVAAATELRLPVVTRGAGTAVTGAAAGGGAVVLDLRGLDRILEIDVVDGLARVEPGVVVADLDRAAAEHGLLYAPDPGSSGEATVGGTIATNAGGLRGAAYGVTRDAVLALDVVLADGRLVHVGRDTLKGVVGLDLTGLLVGSQGTLGIVVGATVRLLPRPSEVATLAAFFGSVVEAAGATSALAGAGVRPVVLELFDSPTLAAIDELRGTSHASRAGAFVLAQTSGPGAGAEVARIEAVLAATALSIETTLDPSVAAELTAARRDALPAVEARAASIGGRVRIEDIAVPRSQLADAVAAVQKIAERHGVEVYVFAHAGDGNLHPILLDRGDPASVAAADAAAEEVFALALSLGGTVSGEHGTGVLKREWARRELDPVALHLQRRIQRVFDPSGLLNPAVRL